MIVSRRLGMEYSSRDRVIVPNFICSACVAGVSRAPVASAFAHARRSSSVDIIAPAVPGHGWIGRRIVLELTLAVFAGVISRGRRAQGSPVRLENSYAEAERLEDLLRNGRLNRFAGHLFRRSFQEGCS